MQCPKHFVIVFVIAALTSATPVPSVGTTTARSPAQIGETIKQLTNQLMEKNATSAELVTLDTRTPPKIKQHTKKKNNKNPIEELENSHAGVAIPVNEDEIILEETTKKLNFYKVEKPTTNGGLSTWILLSGQTTPKPSRKPIVKPLDTQNVTLVAESNKIVKPIFKKRITTSTTTTTAPSTTKLTKVKASLLNGAKKSTTTSTTVAPTSKTTAVSVASTTVSTTTANSSTLPLEAKEGGDTDLNSSTETKTKRPTTKRKKNKNRRRQPSEKTANSSTKLDKPLKSKEEPIGTQLYNYLSKEVMSTVGVGLVGLMVTAGLAGYFLYPFGVARRSYDIDRRDKDNLYYYNDEYSGGIAEEEAIGKVIAGMPSNSLYGNNFKSPTSRHSFNNRRIIEQSTAFTVAEEEVTPAAVPEHGPRSLRKRRQVVPHLDIAANELDATFNEVTTTTQSTTSTSTTLRPATIKTLVDTLKELFHLKVHLGLQLLQNATMAVSKYVSHVQRKFNDQYKNH